MATYSKAQLPSVNGEFAVAQSVEDMDLDIENKELTGYL